MEALRVMDGIPIVAVVLGATANFASGMIFMQLRSLNQQLGQLNGKVFTHITNPGIHEASVARTDEQVKNLMQTVKVAHARLDALSGSPGPRGLPGPQGERGERGEHG